MTIEHILQATIRCHGNVTCISCVSRITQFLLFSTFTKTIACFRLSVSGNDRKSGRRGGYQTPLVIHLLFRSSSLTESLKEATKTAARYSLYIFVSKLPVSRFLFWDFPSPTFYRKIPRSRVPLIIPNLESSRQLIVLTTKIDKIRKSLKTSVYVRKWVIYSVNV